MWAIAALVGQPLLWSALDGSAAPYPAALGALAALLLACLLVPAAAAAAPAIEPSKRACAVSWNGVRGRFAGWVTVFYALEAKQLVWHYTLRVKRGRARAA